LNALIAAENAVATQEAELGSLLNNRNAKGKRVHKRLRMVIAELELQLGTDVMEVLGKA
jgi:hypothetical protein